jgi:hypothetical protein
MRGHRENAQISREHHRWTQLLPKAGAQEPPPGAAFLVQSPTGGPFSLT